MLEKNRSKMLKHVIDPVRKVLSCATMLYPRRMPEGGPDTVRSHRESLLAGCHCTCHLELRICAASLVHFLACLFACVLL